MTLPTIHLNGTSAERLLDGLTEVVLKLDEAYEALRQTAPNGRDYYPQGPAAMEAATAEHMDRLRRLDALKAEVEQLADGIYTASR